MRNITGIGAGNGPFMVIHDGFIGLETWNGFLEGSDRLSLESHYYFAFSPDSYETNFYNMVTRPCQWWAPGFNQSTLDNGLTIGGEWSIAPNDCGLWLNAVGEGSYFDGSHSNSNGRSYGSCTQYTDVRTFSDTFKEQLRAFTLANMDTFRESIRHEVNFRGRLADSFPFSQKTSCSGVRASSATWLLRFCDTLLTFSHLVVRSLEDTEQPRNWRMLQPALVLLVRSREQLCPARPERLCRRVQPPRSAVRRWIRQERSAHDALPGLADGRHGDYLEHRRRAIPAVRSVAP